MGLHGAPLTSRVGTAAAVLAAVVFALGGVAAGARATEAAARRSAAVDPRVEICGTGSALRRPSSMVLTCADHGEVAENLDWSGWSGSSATATGDVTWRVCAAQCAAAKKWDHAAAQVALTDPIVEPGGAVLFSRLTLHVTGPTPRGFLRDLTFDVRPLSGLPAMSPPGLPAMSPHPSAASSAGASSSASSAASASPVASGSSGPSGALSYADIEGFWIAAGGPSSVAGTAAAITGAESSFLPGIIQPDVDYCGAGSDKAGWGLWQITCGDSVPAYGTDFQLLDPWNNAEAAVAKYEQDEDFSPRSTYTSGAYEDYLENPTATKSLTDPGEYVQVNSTPPGTPASPAADPGSTYGPEMPGNLSGAHAAGPSPIGPQAIDSLP